MKDVLDQLSGRSVKFDDEIQGLCLLNTLPDSWGTLRVSLTNSFLVEKGLGLYK